MTKTKTMDHRPREATSIVLDWDFEIDDRIQLSAIPDEPLALAKPGTLIAADLDPTMTTLLMKETSDPFYILSDTSDTSSVSNDDDDKIVTFDPNNEDIQQGNVSECDARGR